MGRKEEIKKEDLVQAVVFADNFNTRLVEEYGLQSKIIISSIIIFLHNLRWNLKNLSRGLNPPKPGLNLVPA